MTGDGLRAAAGAVDLRPRIGSCLTGFGSRLEPSQGVRDPLLARLLFLDDGTTRLSWVCCEVIGFSPADDLRLREIVASSLRAREIVKKLLLFARQTPPKKARINLNEIVEDALFLLEAGCETQGIHLMRRLAADLPTVEADPIQIRQVLVNLTVNAMQAIGAEGTVTVETLPEAQNVILAVSDTGHGMSPEILSKIFSPFFTTKDVGEGTGLGLSIIYGIIIRIGGKIDAQSTPGRGTTIRDRTIGSTGASRLGRRVNVTRGRTNPSSGQRCLAVGGEVA